MSKQLFVKGVSYSYLRQITVLIVGVISLPLTLNYFGNTVYGVWVLVVGVVGYLNNISFGIPVAMITLVAKTSNTNQKYQVLKKSFNILTIIISLILILFVLLVSFETNWIIFLLGNIDVEYVTITKKIFIIYTIATLLKIPLNLYVQFFVGMNMVYVSEIYNILTTLSGLIIVLITIYFKLNIFIFITLVLGGQLALNVLSLCHVLIKFSYLKNEEVGVITVMKQDILKSGFAFFQVGIAATLVWSTDNLVISHFLSPGHVTSYSITFKCFTYVFMFSAILNGVIGPMYGDAFANREWGKIKRFSSLILKVLPIVGAFVWAVLMFFTKEIINIWTHNENAFGGYLLIFSLGLYGYILSYVNTYATLIFSLNFAKHTLKIVWSEAILNLILSIVLIQFLGIGGVALATAFASFLACFLFLPKSIKKLTEDKIIFDYSYLKNHFIFLVLPLIAISICSIYIKNILFKILLFILIATIYSSVSWIFLTKKDKLIFVNIIKRDKKSI